MKNQIVTLPNDIDRLSSLTELNISWNSILELPPSLGKISSLTALNISHNELDDLPPTLGFLKNLKPELFLFEKNKFRGTWKSTTNQNDAASLLGYLADLMKGSQKIFRMRLMVVGEENVGKTTLVTCLKKIKAKAEGLNQSTNGIAIDNWNLNLAFGNDKTKKDIQLTVWDFAGQEIYYVSHQFFMSKRSVYLLAWNLTKEPESSKLEFWLHCISMRAKDVPVFVVGTHLDDPSLTNDVVTYKMTKIKDRFTVQFPNLKLSFHKISCSNGENLKALRRDIEEAVVSQKHMGETIPTATLMLERLLQEEAIRRVPPIISRKEFRDLALKCNITDDQQLTRAAKLLHELGSMVYFETDHKLNDTVVLDPKWLTSLLATVWTTYHTFNANGILPHQALPQIWREPLFPNKIHAVLLSLLENFEIAFPLTPFSSNYDGQSLIPSLLPANRPPNFEQLWPDQLPTTEKHLSRCYKFDFIPYGLFGRLIVRCLRNFEATTYWRGGIVLMAEDRKKILIELLPELSMMRITARTAGKSVDIPRDIIETVETLIRYWYRVNMQVLVPCLHCVEELYDDPTMFQLEECQTLAVTGKQYINCRRIDTMTPVNLDRLVPDLTLKNLDLLKINYEDLKFQGILGEGGAAFVSKGEWNKQLVAIKKLKMREDFSSPSDQDDQDESFSKIFNEFRREVFIMSGLEHPNLVNLKGLCMDPLCIVTEFLAFGDLNNYLRSGTERLPWNLNLKIAADIAAGMSFLHSAQPPIIHRDLKSPNVLLASLDWFSPAVAKVADFGLSGAIQTVSNREVANPIWLAPEIMNGAEFSESSDIYGFGIILWEILTRKEPFSEIKFKAVMETKIKEGLRPQIPDDVPASYADLMRSCWHQDSSQRPSFKKIVTSLNAIREELCRDDQIPPTTKGNSDPIDASRTSDTPMGLSPSMEKLRDEEYVELLHSPSSSDLETSIRASKSEDTDEDEIFFDEVVSDSKRIKEFVEGEDPTAFDFLTHIGGRESLRKKMLKQ
eukprot:TRINITY_DN4710_c0_g2_i3.p1 TRINITY_DN4710_c0_g2~~TRINITY_DN4710_c0_g2_i3.p1  ORF type:complete len:1173 (+),score=432.27 TRINITY_DN4710_c0_g2_i3:488-3520(+)